MLSRPHPGVEPDGSALLLNQRTDAIGRVHGPAQVAIHGPVAGPPLMLVLQGRELDGLDVHAGVHQLANPGRDTKAGSEQAPQGGRGQQCEQGLEEPALEAVRELGNFKATGGL